MAVDRVLTSDEKFSLQNDSRFQNLAKQSTLDNSLMWTEDDGSSYLTEDERVIWAKSRLRGRSIVTDPAQVQVASISPQFIIFLENIDLWDSAFTPWAPGSFALNEVRTYGGNIFQRLTNGFDTFLTPPVEGLNWTQTGVVNETILNYMEANAIFVTLADSWMDSQIRAIDM